MKFGFEARGSPNLLYPKKMSGKKKKKILADHYNLGVRFLIFDWKNRKAKLTHFCPKC